MYIDKPVTKTFRFTGSPGESPFEFDLPIDYTYLVGFTFSAGSNSDFQTVQQALVGQDKVTFDSQIILEKDTPIRITQATEVCYDCKFWPVHIENLNGRKIKVKGSLVLSNATEVVIVLLMTNKKPQFTISPEAIKYLQECQYVSEL